MTPNRAQITPNFICSSVPDSVTEGFQIDSIVGVAGDTAEVLIFGHLS